MSTMTQLYTEEEAAKFLRISARALAAIRRRGEITHLRISRSVRYEHCHLMGFLQRAEVQARERPVAWLGYRGAGIFSDRNHHALADIV